MTYALFLNSLTWLQQRQLIMNDRFFFGDLKFADSIIKVVWQLFHDAVDTTVVSHFYRLSTLFLLRSCFQISIGRSVNLPVSLVTGCYCILWWAEGRGSRPIRFQKRREFVVNLHHAKMSFTSSHFSQKMIKNRCFFSLSLNVILYILWVKGLDHP